MSRLCRRDDPRDKELKPNVIAEHLRSKNELSVLQQVIPLLRLESPAYQEKIELLEWGVGVIFQQGVWVTLSGTDRSPCGNAISAVVVNL